VTVRVWAPTARDVRFLLFDRPSGGDPVFETAMRESADGVWTAVGPIDWEGKYYQFSVDVFHPWGGGPAGAFVRSRATDPYSKSLSADGERSHVCDLNSPDLKPAGWDDTERWKSTCVQSGEPTDYAIYELHVRDFSAMDESTSWDVRGKYLAFRRDKHRPCEPPQVARRRGINARPLTPHVRLRLCSGARGVAKDRRPRLARVVAPELAGPASRGGERRERRRLQLGLRPRALRRPGGLLRHEPRRRDARF
jgi:hypothetical protein